MHTLLKPDEEIFPAVLEVKHFQSPERQEIKVSSAANEKNCPIGEIFRQRRAK